MKKFVYVIILAAILFILSCYKRDIGQIYEEHVTISKALKDLDERTKNLITEIEKIRFSIVGDGKKGARLSTFVEDIRADLNALKGKIEENQYNIDLLTKSISDFLTLQEKRLNEIKTNSMGILKDDLNNSLAPIVEKMEALEKETSELKENLKGLITKFNETKIEAANESLYEKGLNLFKEKKYEDAINYFEKFVLENPKDKYADNAQFFIGDAFYRIQNYDRAITEFQKVKDQYKNSDVLCQSTLKQVYSFYEIKKFREADLFLEEAKTNCNKNRKALKEIESLKVKLKKT